jgi:hypothetical protein
VAVTRYSGRTCRLLPTDPKETMKQLLRDRRLAKYRTAHEAQQFQSNESVGIQTAVTTGDQQLSDASLNGEQRDARRGSISTKDSILVGTS